MAGSVLTFLLSGYQKAGQTPKYIHICGKKYMVPFSYVEHYEQYQKAFLKDFFDQQRRERALYRKRKLKYRTIVFKTEKSEQRLIVPFHMRHQNYQAEEIAAYILKRADKTYQKAIRLACKLSKIYKVSPFETFVSTENINKMQRAYYAYQLRSARSDAIYITKKVSRFLAHRAVKATDHIAGCSMFHLKSMARSWGVRLVLAATISEAIFEAVKNS